MPLPKPANSVYVLKTSDLVTGDAPGITLPNSVGNDNKPHKDLQENIDYLDTTLEATIETITTPLRDSVRNLVIKNNTTNPNYQMDVTFDECILQNASGMGLRIYVPQSYLLDISAGTGLNKLDTGSEAASTWYYIWVVSNGTTHGSLLSTSLTAPVMPSGYTFKALVGSIYNSSASHFIKIYQRDNLVGRTETAVLENKTTDVPTPTAISLVAIVPPTAKKILGAMKVQYGDVMAVFAYVNAQSLNINRAATGYGSGGINYSTLNVLCINQEIYYTFDKYSVTNNGIWVSGWEY